MQVSESIPSDAEAVAPSDTASVRYNALYVGQAGDVKVTTMAGTEVLFKNKPAGGYIPLCISKVWSTGTTAAHLVGFKGLP